MLYACYRTFSREVTTTKLGITAGERFVALDMIQKLAYATCADQYNRLYDQLQTSVPATVLKYFDDNWHNIRAELCLGLKFVSSSFTNTTNNRLERLNGQLKEVIGRETSLEEFIDKGADLSHQPGSSEDLQSQLLTTYAAEFVLKQLQLHSKVTVTVSDANDAVFHVSSHEGHYSCQLIMSVLVSQGDWTAMPTYICSSEQAWHEFVRCWVVSEPVVPTYV